MWKGKKSDAPPELRAAMVRVEKALYSWPYWEKRRVFLANDIKELSQRLKENAVPGVSHAYSGRASSNYGDSEEERRLIEKDKDHARLIQLEDEQRAVCGYLKRLADAVDVLPGDEADIIRRHYLEGMSWSAVSNCCAASSTYCFKHGTMALQRLAILLYGIDIETVGVYESQP